MFYSEKPVHFITVPINSCSQFLDIQTENGRKFIHLKSDFVEIIKLTNLDMASDLSGL